MSTHQTNLAQICRTIANTTRLQLLWGVLENKNRCVWDLAIRAKISDSNASNQLRSLARSGLIMPTRGKLEVIYKPESHPDTMCAKALLPVLKDCYNRGVSFDKIIHQATSFTHERRIQVARCLGASDERFDSLLDKTGMTTPSLNRHSRKLLQRNIIRKDQDVFHLKKQTEPLPRCLLKLAVYSS